MATTEQWLNATPRARQEMWIQDLETTGSAQGPGQLYDGDCFCCLGRLCHLKDPDGWKYGNGEPFDPDDEARLGHVLLFEYEDVYLPDTVYAEAGMTDSHGSFKYASLDPELRATIEEEAGETMDQISERHSGTDDDLAYVSLANLNDAGVSFKTIARVIRARPEGLFVEAGE